MDFFAVEPIGNCPHMLLDDHFIELGPEIDLIDLPCEKCNDKSENWVCLKCHKVFCSRYVNGDFKDHYQNDKSHCLGISFSDLSVWCNECESYIKGPKLANSLKNISKNKFNEKKEVKEGKKETLDKKVILPTQTENWPRVKELLKQKYENMNQLSMAIEEIENFGNRQKLTVSGSRYCKFVEQSEQPLFFSETLPFIQQLSLEIEDAFPNGIPLFLSDKEYEISFTKRQVAILLANAFFGTFNLVNPHTLSDLQFPDFDFRGVRYSPSSPIKCILHYFSRIQKQMPTGFLKVERKMVTQKELPNWKKSKTPLSKVVLHPTQLIEDLEEGLHADFANEYIGGGVLTGGNVQEEILFVVKPECLVTLLFCAKMELNESIIISGAERFSKYTGYGGGWKFNGDFVDKSKRDSTDSIITKIIAIDATVCFGNNEQYTTTFERDLIKCFVGFRNYSKQNDKGEFEENLPAITGNWGCGAFGGNKELKFFQQLLVISETGRDLHYCPLSEPFSETFTKFIEEVKGASVSDLYNIYKKGIKEGKIPCQKLLEYISNQYTNNKK